MAASDAIRVAVVAVVVAAAGAFTMGGQPP